MLGREESTELLTPGVGKRKSTKTETIGGQKAGISQIRGRLTQDTQEANLSKRS